MAESQGLGPTPGFVNREDNSDGMADGELSHACASDVDDEAKAEQEAEAEIAFRLPIHLHGKPIDLPFSHPDATIQDLSDTVAEALLIPPANQKFLITPKTGLLKPPFRDPTLPLHSLQGKKIVLMGATTAEITDLAASLSALHTRNARRQAALQAGRKITSHPNRDWAKIHAEARYTFHTLRPLPYLSLIHISEPTRPY